MVPHRDVAPLAVALQPPDQGRRRDIMAVAQHVGPYLDGLADDALDRKPAAIDTGVDVLDAKSAAEMVGDMSRAGLGSHVR